PQNVLWRFALSDQCRLRHWPDLLVRPAGLDVGDQKAPTGLLMFDAFELKATPAQPSVAHGVPVRIGLVLGHLTNAALAAPPSLSLKSGFVRGRVIDEMGVARTFLPFLVSTRGVQGSVGPGASLEDSLTLFSGPEGDLFPAPGTYRIVVDVRWH